MNSEARYQGWIGKQESSEEWLAPAPAAGAAAMLDDTATPLDIGADLPPIWHWFYFLTKAPQSALGDDGHPRRGGSGFMPPIDLPRRMFAGARMRFSRPLRLGQLAQRRATIRNVAEKAGKSGRLAFVTVAYTFAQDGEVCVEEEQDIVYREAGGAPIPPPETVVKPTPAAGSWVRDIVPDPQLLFRFSALTFNAHRIHYDRAYAMSVEGYPGLVVHGPLTAFLLMELVRRHAGRPVTAFSFRGQAPLFDLAPFRLLGSAGGDQVDLRAVGPDGRVAMQATAHLG